MLTPLRLEILLHYYSAGPAPFPRDSERILDHRQQLVNLDLLEVAGGSATGPDGNPDDCAFVVSERGTAWLKRVLGTPLPTLRWGWGSATDAT